MKPMPFMAGLGTGLVLLVGITTSVSAVVDHVVISEIQTDGATAGDEFVELYNPTENAIDLTGWRLTRKNQAGTSANLVASISGIIQPGGYYLIARPTYDGAVLPDEAYSATSSSFTNTGTVLLFSDAGVTLVDKVGMGTATDFETAAAQSPVADGSIERILDQDTDDNSADFVLRTISDPQNSLSVVSSPTPTNSPSPTVTVTATPTNTPTPTITHSPTPTNTPLPTLTPTPTLSPTPTVTVTVTPSPTPTVTVTVTVTPPVTPTPIPPSFPNIERFVFKLLRSILRPIFRF